MIETVFGQREAAGPMLTKFIKVSLIQKRSPYYHYSTLSFTSAAARPEGKASSNRIRVHNARNIGISLQRDRFITSKKE